MAIEGFLLSLPNARLEGTWYNGEDVGCLEMKSVRRVSEVTLTQRS
jgi:hypothetical protein